MSESLLSNADDNSAKTYQVLARKYRPTTFEDMIGQEAMVTTLTNAFKAGRVAHAFMLTGVRGIGKTTTARLLARALNYEREGHDGPSVALGTRGVHCERIMASQHMDVLEMDAASRTGVDNMREMLDGVRYAPVEARYKVYIIDEVHMLSAGAFNALLKTLEEPPDHAKFIFATTEIRKVPITVLSRCQRFDLRRVDTDALKNHLSAICTQENVKVSDEGLALIARAAEGSVRDSLSLLDQAIVQSGLGGDAVSGEQVRMMLGLADRVRVLDLFEQAARGDGAAALSEMRSQYDDGADPIIVMRDLLDICHEVSRAKTLGEAANFEFASDQISRIHALAEALSLGQLTRIWQMLLKAHTEVRTAPAPLASAEMALLKIAVAGTLPAPELIAQMLTEIKSGNFSRPQRDAAPEAGQANAVAAPNQNKADTKPQSAIKARTGTATKAETRATSQTTSAPGTGLPVSRSAEPRASETHTQKTRPPESRSRPTDLNTTRAPASSSPPQPATERRAVMPVPSTTSSVILNSLEDLVSALPQTQIQLASDIKRHVKPIRFTRGSIHFEPSRAASPALTGQIVSAIKELTGELWIVTPESEGGGETLIAKARREKKEQESADLAHPAFTHPLLANAKLIEIIDTTPTSNLSVPTPETDPDLIEALEEDAEP